MKRLIQTVLFFIPLALSAEDGFKTIFSTLKDKVDVDAMKPADKRNVVDPKISWATEEGKTGLRITAPFEKKGGGYTVWNLTPFLGVPISSLERGGEIAVRVKPGTGTAKVTIRLWDSENEFLQFAGKAARNGWMDSAWVMDESQIAGVTWGGKTNGRIDFPLKEIHLAVDGKDEIDLFLESVEYKTPATVRKEKEALAARDKKSAEWMAGAGLSFSGIPSFAVFYPEDAPVWNVSFKNASDVSWEYSVRSPFGVPGETQKISAGSSGFQIPLPVNLFGPVAVDLRAVKDGSVIYQTNLAYSVVHKIAWKWKSGDAMLGICTHIEGRLDKWSDLKMNAGEEIARLYRYLGVSHDRGELVAWNGLEPQEGQFNWEKKDRVMKYLKDLGVRAYHIYAYTVQWATTGDPKAANYLDWARAAPRIEPFARYCAAVAERYKDQIDGHEIWNEANWGFWKSPTSEYVKLALASKQAINKVDPGKIVVPAGHAQGEWGKVEEIVKGTVAEFPQAAFHIHGGYEEAMDVWENKYWPIYSKYGYKADQLIDTETGTTTVAGGIAITNQALVLQKKLLFQLSRGISGVMWYDLLADGPDPKDGEHHYGIVAWDRTLKPAFAAYNYLISQIGGAKPVTATKVGASIQITEFKQGPDRIAILWNQKDFFERPARLAGFPGEATLTDMFGNKVSSLKSGDGFTVSGNPVWVRIPNFDGTLNLEAGRLIAEGMIGAPPGDWAELQVRWKEDLGGKSLQFKGDQLEFEPARLDLSASDRSKPVKVRLKNGSAFAEGRIQLLDGSKEMESLVFRMNAAPRLQKSTAIAIHGDASDQKNLTPTLVRDQRESVKELLTFVGGDLNEFWQGTTDLSGKMFLSSDAKNLNLHLEIADDKIVEPEGKPEDMWKADSIQLAIDNLGGKLFEIGLAVKDGKPLFHAWRIPQELKGQESQIQYAATRTDGKIYYTLSIPLSLLDKKPGDLIGLSALANDADKKLRKQFLEFGGGIGFSKDPSQYLKFTLAK